MALQAVSRPFVLTHRRWNLAFSDGHFSHAATERRGQILAPACAPASDPS